MKASKRHIRDFGTLIRARAIGARAVFNGHNMRLRPTGVVHMVHDADWLDGSQIPAPKCGASTIAGPLADGVATDEPVNCLRCLRGRPAFRPAPGPVRPVEQRPLVGLEVAGR